MAVTESNHTVSNSSTTNYSFTFPYLKTTDVKVSINGTASSAWTFHNATTVKLNSNPTVGDKIRIYRETDDSDLQATFYAGSSIKASDLNDNFTQTLYVSQESNNKIDTAWTSGDETIDSSETWVSNDLRVGTTQAIDGRIDSKIDTALTGDVVAGNKITVTDNSPSSGKITVAVTSGSLVDSDVNASAAIAGTKVSPNFGSQNVSTSGTLGAGNTTVSGNIVVTGTVDGRDVAADGTKLDGIDTGAKDDQTAAEIRVLVEAASDSNVFTDADHTKLNAIEDNATADQTAAEIRSLVGSASDSNVFTDADHSKLDGIDTGAKDDQTAAEIKTLIASSPLDASHLAADSVTTSEIADAELKVLAGMPGGTASTLADSTALDATTTEINSICENRSSQTTITNDDTKIPTSGAVVDYVAAQIAPLGGLEVIANEDNFPATQPASGVVISIADAGGIVVNGSGVSTTARTAGNGSDNVTINGFPSTLYSTTLVDNMGLLVSSTGSSNTYTYHKLLGKEDDIKQLSSDINDFKARYRVGSSNPTSDNDAGDLFFNTATDKLLVRNAANNSWDEAQSVGNFYISTLTPTSGSGNPFDGSHTEFTITNAPTYASQVLLIINGVLQKPNAGTSAPADGFALDGSTVKLGGAPATGSTYSAVVIGSTVNIGTPSDNTVDADILQSGCVSDVKVAANAAIAGSKISPNFGDQDISGGKISLYDNGSSSPTVLIATDDGSPYALQIRNDGVSNAASSGLHFWQSNSGLGNIRLHGATAYLPISISQKKVDTNDDKTALYIDASQNVGIGTATPHAELDIERATGTVEVQLQSRDSSDCYISFGDNEDADVGQIRYLHSNNSLEFKTDTATALTIDSSQNVGIGTTSPAGKVEIYNAGQTNNRVAITVDEAQNSASRIDFKAGTGSFSSSNVQAAISGEITNSSGALTGDLVFYTNSGDSVEEGLRITSGGKVLIGTTNTAGIHPQSGAVGLRVKSGTVGSNYGQGVISLMGSGGDFYAMTMRDSANNGWGLLPLFSPTVDRFSIGYYDAEASPAVNKTIFTLNEQGNVIINDGNLEVANGHGIDFSASESGSPNTNIDSILDDYEEGTWSPTMGAGTVTVSTAKYVKIGRTVHIWATLTDISENTSGAQLRVEGMPFTTNIAGAIGSMMAKDVNSTNTSTTYLNNSEYLYFYGISSGNSWSTNTYSDCNANTAIYFCGTYHATA